MFDNFRKILIFTSKLKSKNMIYKITLLSDEVDDFVRVIHISPEASFLSLNDAILDAVGYDKKLMTSFFMCSDSWEKGQEVTLMEMESSSEYDNLVMESTCLEELMSDEKQKFIFVFDMLTERALYAELTDIIPGKSVENAVCVQSQGNPPEQAVSDDEYVANSKIAIDENFYGDEDFNIDELDEEGFGDMNFDDSTLFTDDKY